MSTQDPQVNTGSGSNTSPSSSPNSLAPVVPPSYRSPSPTNSISSSSLSGDEHQRVSRLANIEGQLFITQKVKSGSDLPHPEIEKKPFWCHIVGGYLAWFLDKDDSNITHGKPWKGRIELKSATNLSLVLEETPQLFYFVIVMKENKLMKEDSSNAMKAVEVEMCYILSSNDIFLLKQWRTQVDKEITKRRSVVPQDRHVHQNQRNRKQMSDRRSLSLPLAEEDVPKPDISHDVEAIVSNLHNTQQIAESKKRLVKQQGYLEMSITVEQDGKIDVTPKQKYWFELMGGYLHWYQSDHHDQTFLGRLPIKIDSEVEDVISEVDETGKKICWFAVASMEKLNKHEDIVTDAANQGVTIVKTTMKKQRQTYKLYSTNEILLREWYSNIQTMAKRRTKNVD